MKLSELQKQQIESALQQFHDAKEDATKLAEFITNLGDPRKKWPIGHGQFTDVFLRNLKSSLTQDNQGIADAYLHTDPHYLAYVVVVTNRHIRGTIVSYATGAARRTPDALVVKWAKSLVQMGILSWDNEAFWLNNAYAVCMPQPRGIRKTSPLNEPVSRQEVVKRRRVVVAAPQLFVTPVLDETEYNTGVLLQTFESASGKPQKLAEFFSTLGTHLELRCINNRTFRPKLCRYLRQCLSEGRREEANAYLCLDPEYLANLLTLILLHPLPPAREPRVSLLGYANQLVHDEVKNAFFFEWLDLLVERRVLVIGEDGYQLSHEYNHCYPKKGAHLATQTATVSDAGPAGPVLVADSPRPFVFRLAAEEERIVPLPVPSPTPSREPTPNSWAQYINTDCLGVSGNGLMRRPSLID
jgi:hypothetical protein